MKKKMIPLVSVLFLSLLLAVGCFGGKPLQSVSAKGEVYTMQLELPLALGSQPKEIPVNPQLKEFLRKGQSYMERPTGEDIHMVEVVANTMNTGEIEKKYGDLSGEKAQKFYGDMGKALTDSYIQSLSKAAKMTNVTTNPMETEIDGHKAIVTTVNCKMRGEAEVMKVVYLYDKEESWLLAIAYPKEKEDGIGKQLEEKIIPGIKLVR